MCGLTVPTMAVTAAAARELVRTYQGPRAIRQSRPTVYAPFAGGLDRSLFALDSGDHRSRELGQTVVVEKPRQEPGG